MAQLTWWYDRSSSLVQRLLVRFLIRTYPIRSLIETMVAVMKEYSVVLNSDRSMGTLEKEILYRKFLNVVKEAEDLGVSVRHILKE